MRKRKVKSNSQRKFAHLSVGKKITQFNVYVIGMYIYVCVCMCMYFNGGHLFLRIMSRQLNFFQWIV